MNTNWDRIAQAQAYIDMQDEPDQEQESLTDALANLMHWAEVHDCDFLEALRVGGMQFAVEAGG